jgi:hypothetical protein
MRSAAGLVGWGQLRWWERLTPQLDILRLMTRGFSRGRRSGSGSARISAIACWWAASRLWGGKSRLGAGAAAGGAEAADER